jgi:hypothetical protein
MSNRWVDQLVNATIAIASLVGVVVLQQAQLSRPSSAVENPKQAEQQEATRLSLLKQMPLFGYDNVTANWVFLNFLQYFGDEEARSQTGYSLSPNYFDTLITLDPQFVDIYQYLSNSISYQLGKPEVSVKLLQRAAKGIYPDVDPRAFQVWRFMGLDQLLLLGDIPGAIKSHEMAAKWVEGTEFQDFAQLFQGTAEFLRSDPDSAPVRIASWGAIYAQAAALGDKQTQARAKRQIEQLGGKVSIDKNGNVVLSNPPRPKPSEPKPSEADAPN